MKRISLTVHMTFDDEVKDVDQLAANVLDGLIHQANNSSAGLAPESDETFTKEIEVSHNGLAIEIHTF